MQSHREHTECVCRLDVNFTHDVTELGIEAFGLVMTIGQQEQRLLGGDLGICFHCLGISLFFSCTRSSCLVSYPLFLASFAFLVVVCPCEFQLYLTPKLG